MLLRVSSDQQLEADGDLSVQRSLLLEYINQHEDWVLDKKEYFEGSKSAYKNTSSEREVLQEILRDAKRKEFDILVPYKDDRVGRLMWDTPRYIMNLKEFGVDIYTVKDGCISPENEDITGQLMLTFRYANAQKSSADTGMRVKDTAKKLVEKGKFMGGKAPYGYELQLSGEISKHGRALKHLVIVPEQAEVVKYIYELSLNKEYGSSKIARVLNHHDQYKNMAPNDVWKGGTITSILTNPIYTGHTAYKRRERIKGRYHRIDSSDWTISAKPNEKIAIIDGETWDRTQEKRKTRAYKYTQSLEEQGINVIKRNDGILPLIDVAYCGYCGRKLTNGSKYNYWTIKGTGERRSSKIPIYRCHIAHQGVPHDKIQSFRADCIEPVIFDSLAEYIGELQHQKDIFEEIEKNHQFEKNIKKKELEKQKVKLDKINRNIEIMESNIPNAMAGEYPLSLGELVKYIKDQKELQSKQQEIIEEQQLILENMSVTIEEWDDLKQKIPTWKEVFLNADAATKRVLVNRLVERIDIKQDEIVVRFKINLHDFISQSRITGDHGVS